LFSIGDINLPEPFSFRYRKNDDVDKDKEEFVSLKKGENFQIQIVGKCVYFHVIGDFSSGYKYDFELVFESSDGNFISCCCENLTVRGNFF